MFDRRTLLLSGAAAALAGCASPAPAAPPDPEADAEFRALSARLAQRSRATRAFLLRRFDASRLTPDARVLYDGILPGAEADAALTEFPYGDNGYPYAVTHRNGTYRRAAELRPTDNHRAAARLINRETARMEGNAARGMIAPDFVLDATIAALEPAVRRVVASEDAAHRTLGEALTRQLESVRALRGRAPSEPGVWRLPEGEAFYGASLQFYLGAFEDARGAHERALARCRALQTEADALLRREGLSGGAVADRLRAFAGPHLTPSDPAGKAAVLEEMRLSLMRVRSVIGSAFEGELPAAELHLLPAAQEANGTRGTRRGNAYYVDLGAPRPRWSLPSVVHHELLPGHILQAPFERSAEPLVLQLRYANGYGEGWATYAEQLADELGAFEGDPRGRIGYLQWMLFRMARVVADTGMHVMRWSRDETAAQMRALQGDSIAFVSIEEDIGRMAAQPGFAAAQGLAALHIADLRDRTRRSARNAFTLARFHQAVLRFGPLSPAGLDTAAANAFNA